jgi:hypothetical protein
MIDTATFYFRHAATWHRVRTLRGGRNLTQALADAPKGHLPPEMRIIPEGSQVWYTLRGNPGHLQRRLWRNGAWTIAPELLAPPV